MTLREAVDRNHRAAEQTPLAKAMMDGTLTEELYHQFIFNMGQIYSAIEQKMPFLPNDIQRSSSYNADIAALGRGAGTPLQSTIDYVRYLHSLDIPRAWAHVYVHYLGNMYGGQMMKKRLPWPSKHLDFNNVKDGIAYVRANITDVDPGEANKAFEWTIMVYDELYRTFGSNGSTP